MLLLLPQASVPRNNIPPQFLKSKWPTNVSSNTCRLGLTCRLTSKMEVLHPLATRLHLQKTPPLLDSFRWYSSNMWGMGHRRWGGRRQWTMENCQQMRCWLLLVDGSGLNSPSHFSSHCISHIWTTGFLATFSEYFWQQMRCWWLLVDGSGLNSPGRGAAKAALFTISGQSQDWETERRGKWKKKKMRKHFDPHPQSSAIDEVPSILEN